MATSDRLMLCTLDEDLRLHSPSIIREARELLPETMGLPCQNRNGCQYVCRDDCLEMCYPRAPSLCAGCPRHSALRRSVVMPTLGHLCMGCLSDIEGEQWHIADVHLSMTQYNLDHVPCVVRMQWIYDLNSAAQHALSLIEMYKMSRFVRAHVYFRDQYIHPSPCLPMDVRELVCNALDMFYDDYKEIRGRVWHGTYADRNAGM